MTPELQKAIAEFNEGERAARAEYAASCVPVAKYAPSAFRPNPPKYYAVETPAREKYEAKLAELEAKLQAVPGYEDLLD